MPHCFDDDPAGAVLEYFFLVKKRHPSIEGQFFGRKKAWEAANIKGACPNLWGDFFAVSKSHLLSILQQGRSKEFVRKILDRVFLKLESEHLIDLCARDANLQTTYRDISPLGEDLINSDSHREYLGGLSKVVERWRESVVKIYHPTEIGIGTGFMVKEDLVVTARHVIDDLQSFEVATEDGKLLPHKSHRFPQNENLDIALIELNTPSSLKPFQLSFDFDLLDEVVTFGFPPVPRADNPYVVVNRGEISASINLYRDNIQAIVLSCLLAGGNSGGPVVNRRGQVVGIISKRLFQSRSSVGSGNTQNELGLIEELGYTAAIGSEWIRDLIDNKI